MLLNNRIKALLIGVILLVGCYARFYQLQWHFTHLDGLGVAQYIIGKEKNNESSWFAVADHWTYSPFQFVFTSLLISPEQSYRQILFRGRLPSAIGGFIGLLALLWFYYFYDRFKNGKEIVALTLMAVSLESIVMAKQMHNYALGIFAGVMTLVVLVIYLRKDSISLIDGMIAALALGVLTSMQYSILFLIPAFFLTLYWVLLKREQFLSATVKIWVSGITYVAVIFPLWFFFLSKHINSGNHGVSGWNQGGDAKPFLFELHPTGLFDQLIYVCKFFIGNFIYIFQSNLGFLPVRHPLIELICYILLALFVTGVLSFIFYSDRIKKYVGLFFLVTFLTWVGLVIFQKITFSPTRHNIIYMPFMSIVIAEGLFVTIGGLCKLFSLEYKKFRTIGQMFVSIGIMILFLSHYSFFLDQRKDPYIEEEILSKLKEYNVDAVLPVHWSYAPELMPSIRREYPFYTHGFTESNLMMKPSSSFHRIAWISHRRDLSPENYLRVQNTVNTQTFVMNKINKTAMPLLKTPFEDYHPIYSLVKPSDVEIEYRRLTQDGANAFYFYILERTR